MNTKVRLIPVFKTGKGHEGSVDGWIVHPEDRPVRDVSINKPEDKKKRKQ